MVSSHFGRTVTGVQPSIVLAEAQIWRVHIIASCDFHTDLVAHKLNGDNYNSSKKTHTKLDRKKYYQLKVVVWGWVGNVNYE